MRALASALTVMAFTMAHGAAAVVPGAGTSATVPAMPAANKAMKSVEATDARREPSHAQRNMLIRLEYLGAFGPDELVHYATTILPDRSAITIGTSGSSGSISCCDRVRKKVLSIDEYTALVKQLDATGLSRMQPLYPWPPDSSVVTITLIDEPSAFYHVSFSDSSCGADGSAAPARTHGIPSDPLEQICKLASKIQHVTGADNWHRDTVGKARQR